MLPHGQLCNSSPSLTICKRGRHDWPLGKYTQALLARHAGELLPDTVRTFRDAAIRGEVGFLYDRGCGPSSYTVSGIELDEVPWAAFADTWPTFVCPGCRLPMEMHLHNGPGTPGTARFVARA
jgi:hypothetical protein